MPMRELAARHDDDADRRVKRVALTSAGTAARNQLMTCIQAAPAPFARLSAPQRTQLRDLLLRAIDPATDMREAQREAARLLGPIELD